MPTLIETIKGLIEGTYPHSWLEDEDGCAHEESNLKKGLRVKEKGTHQREKGLPSGDARPL